MGGLGLKREHKTFHLVNPIVTLLGAQYQQCYERGISTMACVYIHMAFLSVNLRKPACLCMVVGHGWCSVGSDYA